MKKYKVVIADDEREVFGRLEQFIDKYEQFEIVGSVGNGYDAFQLIEKVQPDLLITDIIMPFINGIDLIKMVKENYPLVKTVVISGANNFEYTKEAIDLDVLGYLMKPVVEDDVNNLFDKVLEVFKKEELSYMIDDMRVKYETSMENALQNILAVNMLGGSLKTSIRGLENLGFTFFNEKYCVAFIAPYKPDINKFEFQENYYLIKHVASERLKRAFKFEVVQFDEGIAFLIISGDSEFSTKVSLTFNEIIETIESKLNTELLVCISKEYNDLSSLNDAYLETQNVMYSEQMVDFGKIILTSDIVEEDVNKMYVLESDILLIEKLIRKGSEDDLKVLFDELDKKLFLSKQHLSHEYLIINLSNIFLKYARDCNVNTVQIVSNNIISEFSEFRNSRKLFDHFISVIMKVRALSKKTKIDNSERVLQEAIKYIETNYNDPDLSLEEVCKEINISVSHLSMLFKKKKGINFIKYLINYRMETAKNLFKGTNMKVVEIATKCGYNNVYYFSHSFKKYTGVSPRKFRENENKE